MSVSVVHDQPAVSPFSVGDFEVDYVTEDGGQHRVPLADALVVRFETVAPARRFNLRNISGICRAVGGQRPMPATWVTSRGWNAIM